MKQEHGIQHAVRYTVKSAVGPNGQGLVLKLTVLSPDGTVEQVWPGVFLPLAPAENLARGMLAEIDRLRTTTN